MRTASLLAGLIICLLAGLLVSSLATAGRGKSKARTSVASVPPSTPGAAATLASQTQSPESSDPLAAFRDPQGCGAPVSDLEALQAAVDTYASRQVQPDGTVLPAPQDLNDLVKAGILGRVPAPPPGKNWVYNPRKWKVSLANQYIVPAIEQIPTQHPLPSQRTPP